MSEALLILPNMRGGCATVGKTVHTLFRVNGRRRHPMAGSDEKSSVARAGQVDAAADQTALPG